MDLGTEYRIGMDSKELLGHSTDKELLDEWRKRRNYDDLPPLFVRRMWDELLRRHPECSGLSDEEAEIWLIAKI
jgi:hypothetical protein